MASGDFADLYTKAIYGSRRDTSDSFDVARAKDAINEALQAVSFTGDPWSWLEREGEVTLQVGADVYSYATLGTALGTTVSEIMSLVMDNEDGGYRLESMSWDALENVTYGTQDDEQSGEPIFWADWDSKIRVYPKPDEAYVLGVFYRAYQSELSSDSDVPLMPLEWRTRLLVPYACSRLLRQEGGSEAASEADRYMGEYQRAFLECRNACATISSPAMRLATPAWRDQMWMG
jgi:hypothetical protein